MRSFIAVLCLLFSADVEADEATRRFERQSEIKALVADIARPPSDGTQQSEALGLTPDLFTAVNDWLRKHGE